MELAIPGTDNRTTPIKVEIEKRMCENSLAASVLPPATGRKSHAARNVTPVCFPTDTPSNFGDSQLWYEATNPVRLRKMCGAAWQGLLKTRWYAVVAQAVPPAFTSTSDFGDSQLMVRGENLAKRVGQVGNLRTACESVHPGAAGTRCTDSQNRRREP